MQQIDPQSAQGLLQNEPSPRLIDVRERDEYEYCRLAGAELYPLSDISKWEAELADAEEVLLIYCHHGVRSARVCARLHSLGHSATLNLAGGIDRWSADVDSEVPRY